MAVLNHCLNDNAPSNDGNEGNIDNGRTMNARLIREHLCFLDTLMLRVNCKGCRHREFNSLLAAVYTRNLLLYDSCTP
ncbi:hypothetical protein ANTPLA_LOCUS4283 [Anthophora plagiata]